MIDDTYLDRCVLDGIATAGGQAQDAALFARVRAEAMERLNNPPKRIVFPSFELLKPGEKQPTMTLDQKAVLIAICYYDTLDPPGF